jgi:hypothetical protein
MEPDVTACVPQQPYDSPMIADVCAHLPVNMGACSVACDATALNMFAMSDHVVTTYTCQSTDGIIYIAAAR